MHLRGQKDLRAYEQKLAEKTKDKVTSIQVNIYFLGPVAAVHIEKSTCKVPTVELSHLECINYYHL